MIIFNCKTNNTEDTEMNKEKESTLLIEMLHSNGSLDMMMNESFFGQNIENFLNMAFEESNSYEEYLNIVADYAIEYIAEYFGATLNTASEKYVRNNINEIVTDVTTEKNYEYRKLWRW